MDAAKGPDAPETQAAAGEKRRENPGTDLPFAYYGGCRFGSARRPCQVSRFSRFGRAHVISRHVPLNIEPRQGDAVVEPG